MATYTSNYGWTKPSGSDNVDISVLNNNLDDQDSTIHDAFLNMAPPFSESSTYAVDDIVLYTTGLYKCHTAVVTPGSWTGSTNWQVYKLSEGGSGGGGTSNYNDLTNKPSINGVTLSGNKTTSDLGIDKTAVGLGNVPNVSTNDQEPTFTEASTRNNIASGEKLSAILGKVQKFFNDLKTVAFSGSYTDLSNKPQINSVELSGNKTAAQLGMANSNTFQGTIAEWNQLTTAEKKAYDHASITGAGGGEYNVDKSTGDLVQTSGMPSEYPASQVMLSDGVTSVEDKVDELTDYVVDTTTISGVKITKMGHLVMLSIDKTITMQGSQWVNLGAVPYKPTTEIFGVAKQNAVDKIISIDLPTNGNLAVMGSGSSTILVRGSLTYLTND